MGCPQMASELRLPPDSFQRQKEGWLHESCDHYFLSFGCLAWLLPRILHIFRAPWSSRLRFETLRPSTEPNGGRDATRTCDILDKLDVVLLLVLVHQYRV